MLSGFFTIWVIIGLGWLLAHLRVLREDAQPVLSQVSFFVGAPALLFEVMADADLGRVFAPHVLVSLAAIMVAGATYLVCDRLWWNTSVGERVIATFCSAYVNAGNLGLPIAAYVLGDVTWLAPVLLLQICVLQPAGLSVLDAQRTRDAGRAPSALRYISMPLRNPLTLGALTGLVFNLANLRLPALLAGTVSMLAGLAVPTMLIAFGVSLRLGQVPRWDADARRTVVVSFIKVVWMPFVAWLGCVLLGAAAATTLAVTVMAALPTAQNVYVHSVRYNVARPLARDAVFITTFASVPAIALIAALLR